jgi:hypothetical protein
MVDLDAALKAKQKLDDTIKRIGIVGGVVVGGVLAFALIAKLWTLLLFGALAATVGAIGYVAIRPQLMARKKSATVAEQAQLAATSERSAHELAVKKQQQLDDELARLKSMANKP